MPRVPTKDMMKNIPQSKFDQDCKDCNFKVYETTDRRPHPGGGQDKPIWQSIVRRPDETIQGLKTLWNKV